MTTLPATTGRTSLRPADPDVWLPPALAVLSWFVGWATVGVLLDPVTVLWAAPPTVVLLVLRMTITRTVAARGPGGPAPLTLLVAHQVVLVVAVVLNPFTCIYAFVGYLDAVRLLTGRWQIAWTLITAVTCAIGQSGSIPGIGGLPMLFVAITLVNVVVATAMIHADRVRERRVDERERAAVALADAMRDNAALQERLVEQARATGVAQERARLSREIHDTVAQGLVAVIRQLEALPVGLDRPVADRVERAEEAARDCLLEARSAVAALSPHQLADRSLVAALEDMVRRWAREHRIVTELDTDDAPATIPHGAVLLRVAQEGLANVATHAGAATVRMRLAAAGTRTVLEVVDDGVGFDPATVARGRGLDGMAERVHGVGGELELLPGPEAGARSGTVVRASVPTGAS